MAYVDDKYIHQAISDFDSIKSAIVSKGIEVPYDTDTKEYGNLIRSIPEKQDSKPYIDTSKITNFSYFGAFDRFSYDEAEKITVASGIEDFSYMFYFSKTMERVPTFDTSNGKKFSYMFDTMYALTEIPTFNTSNGTLFNNMCSNCTHVVTIGELDLTKATNIQNLFRNNYALETLLGLTFNSMKTSKMSTNIFYKCTKIKNITINGTIKVDSDDLVLSHCPDLTVESMLSILNALEDNTGETKQYTVNFGTSNIDKLTYEQKKIATDKNILLA